ncbi:MAG: dihydrofolate reductase family protein [Pseudomonadota bacterium]|nr:dihydrofolate reductase family protein [Pseudomonadota bacterium]
MKTKDRRNIKAKVIIDMSMSLDGFIAGPDGYARIARVQAERSIR